MKSFRRLITGIPRWLLQEYLEEAGGREDENCRLVGEGWVCELTQMEPYVIGSLCVGQVLVEIEGEPEALAPLMAALEPKLLRAGG